jgi:hypothetical protein
MKHDGFTNKYSFVLNQRSITLVPLTPQQVYDDRDYERRVIKRKRVSKKKKVKIIERPRKMREKKKIKVLPLRENQRENKRISMQK